VTYIRVISVGVIQNAQGEFLICKKPARRGVFPGQWGLPGGGIEDGETPEAALRRELLEEVGLAVEEIQPLFFSFGRYVKYFPDGAQRVMDMLFLLYSCRAASLNVRLNDEFEAYQWVSQPALRDFDLNVETRKTFLRMGLIT
jgi:nucleoside triphosphatase